MTPRGDGPALFISDLHLSPALPRTVQVFEDFLRGPAREASVLFILGDLFEYWIGDDMLDVDTPASTNVDPDTSTPAATEPLGAFACRMTAAMAELSASGVPIAVMRGNRDFLLGERFARAAGAVMLDDPCVFSFLGQALVLSHGDQLCTDDVGYQRFRRIAHSPLGKAFFLALPLRLRMAIANRIRRRSAAKGAHRLAYADANANAIAALLDAAGERTLVHGHTHRPARHADGRRVRWVLPDWEFDVEPPRGGYLQWDTHGLRAIDLAPSTTQSA
ncbi:UDP-2,3-diacylglucosamine diphosphatase [Pandoraea fibrosis]|uniref:UDP-2,3-diacylglucosamine hydrolase n=1 Tax=Pandoraea fibrosis TaxID=1891094 RepID=A0ABX6HTT2_9BURK|nr:UDP-2,3-diacylglucosamine diphosphatase [Pandoraea fibrosis]QHE92102.1 UDP-2,3-diacylglucosamine diphosphatase [Pandoraea fibrosis]QHF14341.1 UDP-2,3-diacylglucosamine diphosphatase [Pandoraea fibrosis]